MRLPRTIWGYLLGAYLRALLLAATFFTAVLFLFFLASFSRSVSRFGIAPGALLGAMLGILPYVLSYSLPLSALAAAVIAWGSLAEAREYTAAVAAGLSPWRLAAPLLVAGALLALADLWLYDAGTRFAFAYFRRALLTADRSALERELSPGRSVELPAGADAVYRVHFGARTPEGRTPAYIVFFRAGRRDSSALAADCRVAFDPARGGSGPGGSGPAGPPGSAEQVHLFLDGAELVSADGTASLAAEELPLHFLLDRQLAAELALGRTNSTVSLAENLAQRNDCARQLAADAAAAAGGGGTAAAPDPLLLRAWRTAATEVHRKCAMAVACLALTLLGLPLGLLARRGSRVLSFALALLVGCVVYLPLVVICKALAGAGHLPPAIIWLPTLLAGIAGAALLGRVGRVAA